jgi:hypothetical protein
VSSGAPDGSRGSLAESAFPGLAIRVHRFNCLYYLLIVTTLVWLLLTTFAYWDVAMGRSTLQRIDRVHVDRATLYQASADVAADGACPEAAAARSVACRRLADLSAAESEAKKDLDNFRTCTGLFCAGASSCAASTRTRCMTNSR